MQTLRRIPSMVKRAIAGAAAHDILNVSQSAAYSSIVALFPGLIVAAAVVALLPDTAPLRFEAALLFHRVLPQDVTPLIASYFVSSARQPTSARALLVAVLVSITGASSVIATFMEGIRRAYELPPDCWSFWRRRGRAFALVPLSLLPLAIASVLVMFGHLLTQFLASHAPVGIRSSVYVITLITRWAVALGGSVGLIAVLYHMAIPVRQPLRLVLPGAAIATAMWFITTLGFGWYVTRFANYSRVYGSLGAGIALLFWLYLTSISVLCGAEFNAQFASFRRSQLNQPDSSATVARR